MPMRAAAVRLAAIASATVLAILILTPAANAQQPASDQYVAGTTAGEATAGTGTGSGGELPFTDYPLTPLVALVGLLLIAGIAARLVVPALDRRRA
jgi:hypothetical protein